MVDIVFFFSQQQKLSSNHAYNFCNIDFVSGKPSQIANFETTHNKTPHKNELSRVQTTCAGGSPSHQICSPSNGMEKERQNQILSPPAATYSWTQS